VRPHLIIYYLVGNAVEWLQLRFEFDSTARRLFEDLRHESTPTRVRVLLS